MSLSTKKQDSTTPVAVPKSEQDTISRQLLIWLNEFPNKPVKTINFEFLPGDQPGMALSTVQGAFKTKNYMRGRYRAEYQFKVVYRLQPGNSNNNRLGADELLDELGDWASNRLDKPKLGGQLKVIDIECNTRSSLFGRYENGDEDHQIFMTMHYCLL